MGKVISCKEAVELVKSNDVIVVGLGAAEGKCFLENLHLVSNRVRNVIITTFLPLTPCKYCTDSNNFDSFSMDSFFYSGQLRKLQQNGNISYVPTHLHLSAVNRISKVKPNIYVGNATPPDKHGFVSLSLSNVYEKRMIESADIVILELNPKLPRTLGDVEVHVDDIDYIINCDYDISTIPEVQPNEKDIKIGKLISDRINDGDCIQLGIGAIPDAVANALMNKKDLGIHTEMFTTGMMKLIKAGVVNGKRKNIYNGKHVAAFALGTRELYDFLDDNPSVMIRDGYWTNDPCTIGMNDNQVSINTSVEVDLTGQCASESIGPFQISGTGGQTDTAVGAQRSKNGRSFIALYSSVVIRDKITGESKEISKIVPQLNLGATVSLSRNDVDNVVTEYGIAELKGLSICERVKRLIDIANPKFRDDLYEEAIKMGIIIKNRF
ncbi:MAG: acetyl-CoA hydrolase/transferase C-terminal domain-containing protein [Clostridium sp.]